MRGTHPCQWIGDAAGMLTMIWERFFGAVTDVPVVSPTSQSRLEKFNSVQLLITSPMHHRHVPVGAGTSPSLTMIWKPGLICGVCVFHRIMTLLYEYYFRRADDNFYDFFVVEFI